MLLDYDPQQEQSDREFLLYESIRDNHDTDKEAWQEVADIMQEASDMRRCRSRQGEL